MNADGKEMRNLTGDTNLKYNRHPTWSRDGRRIAFESQRVFEGHDIYVITAKGKKSNSQLTQEGNNSDACLFAGWEKNRLCVKPRRRFQYLFEWTPTEGTWSNLRGLLPVPRTYLLPGCLAHWQSTQTESCRHLGEVLKRTGNP